MTPATHRFRTLPRILAFGLLVALPALAATFDIPSQPVPSAIAAFTDQSKTKVVFSNDQLQNLTSTAVKGEMEPPAALAKLLEGTGFSSKENASGHFVVVKAQAAAGAIHGSLALPDGSPAMAARVSVYETGQSAETNKDGRFVLTSVPSGTHVLVITSPECQTLHITDVHVRADEELTLAKETLRKADDVAKLEPYEVSAQTIEQMEKYIVNDTNAKPPAFSDANVDIPRGIDDVQPYYIFNSQTIEQSGATNVEDFLKNRLTMDTVAQTNSQNYGTTIGGTSSIGLRGLAASQTLILIDGRRTANLSFNGNDFQPNINGIPPASIDRIEVLPSSASAIYGGSAVGGVINIILKKDYQGGQLKYTYDTPFNADAPLRTFDATYGFSADKGKTHVMVSAQYSDGKALLEGERTNLEYRGIDTILSNSPSFLYSFTSNPFQGQTTNIVSAAPGVAPPGATPYPGLPYYYVPAGTPGELNAGGGKYVLPDPPANLILKNGISLNSPITNVPVGTSLDTSAATLASGLIANAGLYNFNLAQGTGQFELGNPLDAVPRNRALSISINQNISPYLDFFVEGSDSSYHTETQSSDFSYQNWKISASVQDNPFQEAVIINFPNETSAPIIANNVTQNISLGLVAKLPSDWKAEIDYAWSQSLFSSDFQRIDDDAFQAALNSSSINPFLASIDLVNLAYYQANDTISNESTLNDVALRASGPLFSLPGGHLTLTIGLEHRKEGNANGYQYTEYPLTPVDSSSDINFGQSESTNSAYAEIEIPVVTAKNGLIGLRGLALQAAIRTEDYSVGTGTSGVNFSGSPASFSGFRGVTVNGQPYHSESKYTATKPMAGLSYKPVDDIILRASFATAFLPPTYSQLTNNPVASTFPTTISDPKTGQSYGVQTVQNQNSNLTPQDSKNWDIGAIWEPKGNLFKGLRVDLEFFQIKEFNVITGQGAQFFVTNASQYSDRITRDSTTGLITLVDTSNVNLYELETEGYDLSLDYRKQTSIGNFDLYALGTIQEHYKQQVSLNEPFLEYVGFPSEGGLSKIKATSTLTWAYQHWTLGCTTEFFGSYSQFGAPGGPDGTSTKYTLAQGSNSIPSQTIHNVFASYTFGKIDDKHGKILQSLASNWTVQVGVKNVFNTLPPFDAYYAPYFYSPYGDPRLRDLWVSIKHDF